MMMSRGKNERKKISTNLFVYIIILLLMVFGVQAAQSDADSGKANSGSNTGYGPNWQCTDWTTCTTDGTSERRCTRPDESGESIEKRPCTQVQINNNSVEKNQNNQGIGQELSKQISVRKEEIKSGTYNNSLGQLLNVRQLAQNMKELRVNGVRAQTGLNITAVTDSRGKTMLRTRMKNGEESEIKIMPDTASERALERLRVKVCSTTNNCTIELKSNGTGRAEHIQYELQLERHSMILGIFQKKMQLRADVDAENGDINIHKPWWAFMATEPAE